MRHSIFTPYETGAELYTDERDLSQEERSRFNNDFLAMILDELIPWHRAYDYTVKNGVLR